MLSLYISRPTVCSAYVMSFMSSYNVRTCLRALVLWHFAFHDHQTVRRDQSTVVAVCSQREWVGFWLEEPLLPLLPHLFLLEHPSQFRIMLYSVPVEVFICSQQHCTASCWRETSLSHVEHALVMHMYLDWVSLVLCHASQPQLLRGEAIFRLHRVTVPGLHESPEADVNLWQEYIV